MLPIALATLIAAGTPAVRAPADGSYEYAGLHNGAVFGHTAVTVSHTGTAITIAENGSGAVSGETGTAKATLTLASADLSPSAYVANISGSSVSAQSALAFNGPTATLTGIGGNQTFNLLDGTTHYVVVDGALLAGYIALPAQLAAWNNAPSTLIIPVYGQASRIVPDASVSTPRPSSVPAADVGITFHQPLTVTEWYDPATLIPDEIDVPSLQLAIQRSH
jgi:hypothetical protein